MTTPTSAKNRHATPELLDLTADELAALERLAAADRPLSPIARAILDITDDDGDRQ